MTAESLKAALEKRVVTAEQNGHTQVVVDLMLAISLLQEYVDYPNYIGDRAFADEELVLALLVMQSYEVRERAFKIAGGNYFDA